MNNKNEVDTKDKNKYNQYNADYKKKNYKRFNTVIKPDVAERINKYCADVGISKAEFLQRAIDVLDN